MVTTPWRVQNAHPIEATSVTTAPGAIQAVSVPFASCPLSASLGKFRIDVWKPSIQPNPNCHG